MGMLMQAVFVNAQDSLVFLSGKSDFHPAI